MAAVAQPARGPRHSIAEQPERLDMDSRMEAIAYVGDAVTRALGEARSRALRPSVLRIVCHAECIDSDGHSDRCIHDDAESLIP